jgi:hypothetical protein
MNLRNSATVLTLALGFLALPALADDLEKLNGKWSTKKKNEEGQAYTQTLEITKGKFKFQITAEGSSKLYAEGDLKIEKHGAFSALKFSAIKGGGSPSDSLQDVDDDRVCVYSLGYDTLTVAMNFDKDREQGPQLDKYTKEAAKDSK